MLIPECGNALKACTHTGCGMSWLAYAVTCALLHHVLAHHYQDACRPAWWSFGLLDSSAYCALLHRSLQVLGASPLLAALPQIRQHQQHHQQHQQQL